MKNAGAWHSQFCILHSAFLHRFPYHCSVKQRVLSYVRRHGLMRPGDRVGVAVSGGADSVALLRLLLEARPELGIVLSVVHFNHQIRGADADADERFVRQLARGLDLEFHCGSGDTPAYARQHKLSLEAAARKLRYAFFDRLTADATVHRIATAHTRDDQAETVLMRFLRGSGTKGLSGIYPGVGGWISASVAATVRKFGESASTVPPLPTAPPTPRIVRPLLDVSRDELRAYLHQLGQAWREDASNADVSFTRNRLRHEIMPVLRLLNPNLDRILAETSEIAREEERWWSMQTSAAQRDLWGAFSPTERPPRKMRVDVLLAQPLALQRRLVRMMLDLPDLHLDFDHVEAVLELAASEPTRSEKVLELPNGWEAVRQDRELWFRRRSQSHQEHGYTIVLSVPGEWEVAGRKIRLSLLRHPANRSPEGETYVRAVLLDPGLQNRGLRVRNWHAGDRYWPAHTRQPKKLKDLLQARHIPREQKPFWPVVVSGGEIVWVPGFDAPERFRLRDGGSEALWLEEVPL
jgi:tRNA(Ile)-lysidine synthase